MNQLILGDNLEIMRKMDAETIDLIYLDPPFFSNRNYEVIWGDKGEVRSFEDRWSGGIDHYIAWLKERVAEMHRLLKPTGTIYLHCDYHANAYIRVYILDKVFGENNFRNEIIWCYKGGGRPRNDFGRKHDIIYRYSKSENNFIFNDEKIKIPYEARDYGKQHPSVWGKHKGVDKIYMPNDNGKVPEDWWIIDQLNSGAKERIGYPTQKPENLLERIILASSNEGDYFMDAFVGGGTSIVVAERLKRNWIGIDQSVQAVKVSEMRLENQKNLFSAPFSVQLHKYDYDKLFHQDPKVFEIWIVERFGGRAFPKKGGDKGIDGKMLDGTPIQVKQSESIGSVPIRQFVTDSKAFDRNIFIKNSSEGNPIGYFIAFSFGKGAIQEVARLHNEENIIIKLVTVEEIVPIAKKPKLTVKINDLGIDEKGLREIEFIAVGVSDAGIEFFSWDFDNTPPAPSQEGISEGVKFKADVMLDKEGKQTHKFKPGTHNIAVKVIDNEGLEAMEVVRVKVNGEIERK